MGNETEHAEEQAHIQREAETDEKPMRRLFNFLFHEKAGMWTALFTCVLCVFSGLLWKVSKDAGDASILTQRAFITVNNAMVMSKVMDKTNKFLTGYNFNLAWVNSGDTPTGIATYQVSVRVQDTPLQTDTNFDELPQGEKYSLVFGPKEAAGMVPPFVSLSDLEAIANKSSHGFVWGWVEYRDIFKDTPLHVSEFCLQIGNPVWTLPDHANPAGDMNFNWTPCPSHYCYDENCKDYAERVQEFK
jgi:hypothetical protein